MSQHTVHYFLLHTGLHSHKPNGSVYVHHSPREAVVTSCTVVKQLKRNMIVWGSLATVFEDGSCILPQLNAHSTSYLGMGSEHKEDFNVMP